MDFDEALNLIIDGLTDLENYDEALDVIRNARSSDEKPWKSKYEELEKKYKQRFKERLTEEVIQPQQAEEKEEIRFEDIDFDGRTE